jgi:hypothetical protein
MRFQNAFFARRQMRVRRQKAGEESAQHRADVLPFSGRLNLTH